MRIIVNGAEGRMGKIVCSLLEQQYGGHSLAAGTDGAGRLAECKAEADCVIDFSNHDAIYEVLSYCLEHQRALILATTGHSEEEKEAVIKAAAEIPIFFSSNMSIGVALLCDMAKKLAEIFLDGDIEIIERHHNRKLDAPSGTAIMIGNAILKARPNAVLRFSRNGHEKRTKEEIGIHSLRLGNITGIHEIIISTAYETITLCHEAHDKSLFAEGALAAASFIEGKSAGLYSMEDLLS